MAFRLTVFDERRFLAGVIVVLAIGFAFGDDSTHLPQLKLAAEKAEFLDGVGTKKDSIEAAKSFEKAAKQGRESN